MGERFKTLTRPRVFMAMPHYTSAVHIGAAQAFFVTGSRGAVDIVRHQTWGGSLLAKSFNMLWAMALSVAEKEGCEWFVMLHADIVPEHGWVDKLVTEGERIDADVISVVMPLKSQKGLTSTAIDNPHDIFQPLRRLTMREVHSGKIPETFVADDLSDNIELLINTGCMAARLDRPWCRAVDSDGNLRSTFSIADRIKRIDGKWNVGVAPEDWQWSRTINELGGKVAATTAVKASHYGEAGYPNDSGWGAFENDEETKDVWAAKGCRLTTDPAEEYRTKTATD